MTELVQFNGILVRDDVLGKSNGALYERWNPNSPMYSPKFSQAMTLTRFVEIKRNINMSNKYAAKSRDQEGYNPA